MTLEENLRRIEVLCDAASPGPWRQENDHGEPIVMSDAREPGNIAWAGFIAATTYDNQSLTTRSTQEADAALIAAARTDLPALVEMVRALCAQFWPTDADSLFELPWPEAKKK